MPPPRTHRGRSFTNGPDAAAPTTQRHWLPPNAATSPAHRRRRAVFLCPHSGRSHLGVCASARTRHRGGPLGVANSGTPDRTRHLSGQFGDECWKRPCPASGASPRRQRLRSTSRRLGTRAARVPASQLRAPGQRRRRGYVRQRIAPRRRAVRAPEARWPERARRRGRSSPRARRRARLRSPPSGRPGTGRPRR